MFRAVKQLINFYNKLNSYHAKVVRVEGRFTYIGKVKLDRRLFIPFALLFCFLVVMSFVDYFGAELHYYAECDSHYPCVNPFYEQCSGETLSICDMYTIPPYSNIGEKPGVYTVLLLNYWHWIFLFYFITNFMIHNRRLLKK